VTAHPAGKETFRAAATRERRVRMIRNAALVTIMAVMNSMQLRDAGRAVHQSGCSPLHRNEEGPPSLGRTDCVRRRVREQERRTGQPNAVQPPPPWLANQVNFPIPTPTNVPRFWWFLAAPHDLDLRPVHGYTGPTTHEPSTHPRSASTLLDLRQHCAHWIGQLGLAVHEGYGAPTARTPSYCS
jgi:hypothetical protein